MTEQPITVRPGQTLIVRYAEKSAPNSVWGRDRDETIENMQAWLAAEEARIEAKLPGVNVVFVGGDDLAVADASPGQPAEDWGPGRYRVMRLGRDWSAPWRGMQLRLEAFGGSNDEAFTVVEIKRAGDEP